MEVRDLRRSSRNICSHTTCELPFFLHRLLVNADKHSDRSPSAGPLESRRGTLGGLLRLMHSSSHFSTRNAAGEFLWSVCDSDREYPAPFVELESADDTAAATLTAEIGYGNAAGFLFQKGITAPPSGNISDLPPTPSVSSSASSSSVSMPRHPISSLAEPLPKTSDIPMTPAEKQRESERLFVLLERMEKNPIIQMTPEDPAQPGSGKAKGVRELMRDKLESGQLAHKDVEDEEEDRRVREEEEERDEEEVGAEMRRYRARMKGARATER
jgi:hypothetical protein